MQLKSPIIAHVMTRADFFKAFNAH